MEDIDISIGDLSKVFDLENLIGLTSTKDLIGVMLRIHFGLEAYLNLWCNKVAECEDFFDFNDNVSFLYKLRISEKLGLPSELVAVFLSFNRVRNNFAHKRKAIINDIILNDIRNEINKIPIRISPTIGKVEEASITTDDYKKFSWNTPDISSIQKLLLLYFSLNAKAITVFHDEFKEKGIEFSYKEQ